MAAQQPRQHTSSLAAGRSSASITGEMGTPKSPRVEKIRSFVALHCIAFWYDHREGDPPRVEKVRSLVALLVFLRYTLLLETCSSLHDCYRMDVGSLYLTSVHMPG